MDLRRRLVHGAATMLARRGFEVRRHPARRRQRLIASHGVDLVLDVGAADGGYGRELRAFGYSGDIVSFEPRRTAHEALRSRAEGDPAWSARPLALGAEPGEAVINVASNQTSSSLLPMRGEHMAAAPQVRYVGTETITVSTLDLQVHGLLDRYRAPFLKIDTQGFERNVLQGGSDVVSRCVGLQLELSFVPLYEGGMLIDEAVTWAYDHGFRLAVVEQGYAAASGRILQIDGVFLREVAP